MPCGIGWTLAGMDVAGFGWCGLRGFVVERLSGVGLYPSCGGLYQAGSCSFKRFLDVGVGFRVVSFCLVTRLVDIYGCHRLGILQLVRWKC